MKIKCKAVSTTASSKGQCMHLPTHLIGQIDRSSLNFHLLPEYDRVKNSTVTNFDWSIKEASIMKNQRATQILVEASHSTVMICGELKQWVPMNYFLEDFWPPLQVMGCLNQLHHSSESHHKEQFMWETGFSTGSAQTQAPLCTYQYSLCAYLNNATHMPFNRLTINYNIFIIAVKHNLPFSSILWRTWLLRIWNKICCLGISWNSFQNSTWQTAILIRTFSE